MPEHYKPVTEQQTHAVPEIKVPDTINSTAIHTLLGKAGAMTRRDFLTLIAALATGATLASVARPMAAHAHSEQAAPAPDTDFDSLFSKNKIHLGPLNLSDAEHQGSPLQITSDIWEFPEKIPFHTLNRNSPAFLHPANHAASIVQSTVGLLQEGPVIACAHSGIIGKKLPFESLREIEGTYQKDKDGVYIAKFVGKIQRDYRIREILKKKPVFEMKIGDASARFKLDAIDVIPYTTLDSNAVRTIFVGGDLKFVTCGTMASFPVKGATYHCERFKINTVPHIKKALQTLQKPEANDEEIYDAMIEIYYGLKTKSPQFATFFLAAYSRQHEVGKNIFRNLSEEELAKEPIADSNEKGIEYFSAQTYVATLSELHE